ncbi:MAG: hypothetical protein IT384_02100 [Deltaproteobacteria bacterium]|nr:hypothetical protein [Deltaproteobacteria bacterium]
MRIAGLWLATLCLSAVGCVTVATSAGTPTALERQLLGAYDELDRDLVLASSVRGDQARPAGSLEARRALALDGRALQRFNEDDLVELKGGGCIVERLDATVAPRACALISDGGDVVQRRRERVIVEENRARRAILEWAAYNAAREAGRERPSADEEREIRQTYHRLLAEAAQPGHWFETAPGQLREVGR